MNSSVDQKLSKVSEVDGRPFIAGAFAPASGAQIHCHNPATGQVAFTYTGCSGTEVDAAVAAARKVQDEVWSEFSPGGRKRLLMAFADAIMASSDALAGLDSLDIGKPLGAATGEVAIAAGFIRYYAEAIDKIVMGEVPASGVGMTEVQHLRPRGVVAAIIPWNFPLINACLKVGPALAAGNTCVLKPSDISPRSALLMAKLGTDAGLPAGVLNVVPGDADTGSALIGHSDVNLVTFTGSTATGKHIMQHVGNTWIKPMLLECGGKSPEIVFEGVSVLGVEAIAAKIVEGALWNQGQVCVARTRVLIQQSLYEDMAQAVVAAAAEIKPGSPTDPATRFGPLASAVQYRRVCSFIEEGVASGVRVLLDGREPAGVDAGGFYLGPTVLDQVPSESRLAQEEIFGPVILLTPFADETEALALANNTSYGLAATVWTTDASLGQRMARRLKAGKVRLVSSLAMAEPAGFNHSAEPCGQSGFGVEGGLEGMRSYLRRQSVEHLHG